MMNSIIKRILSEYYSSAELVLPPDMELREFAVQNLNGIYVRHLSFRSETEIREFLRREPPLNAYFSSARYRDPSNKDMNEKGWLGSDLIFDIDADHLMQCRDRVLEITFCPRCGYIADTSQIPQNVKNCPNCGAELKSFEHVDPDCVKEAYNSVLNLVDVLKADFGLRNVMAWFSGHRGFHVFAYLEDEDWLKLRGDERRAIVVYLKMYIQNYEHLLVKSLTKKRSSKLLVSLPPSLIDGGIRRRVAKILLKHLPDTAQLKAFIKSGEVGLDAKTLLEQRDSINKLIEDAIKEAQVDVDELVTMDVSRLVRIPNSINGKTGWVAFYLKNLAENFELDSASVDPTNGEDLYIKALVSLPKIRVLDKEVAISRGEVIRLKYPYASYFVFKGVATVYTPKVKKL